MQIFLTSPWVPPEWIRAHRHQPRGIWWLPALGRSGGSLAAGTCAFAQSVCALAEAQPDSAIVFTTHCDQLRRGFDNVARQQPDRKFLFNLPATWQTPVARQIFSAELMRLSEFLVSLGGHRPATDELAGALEAYNTARAQLIQASDWLDGRSYAEVIASFHWDGSVSLPPARSWAATGAEQPVPAPSAVEGPAPWVPIAIVGGPLPRSYWDLFDLVETFGGRVVVNGTEAGERSLGAPLPEEALLYPDPASEQLPGEPAGVLSRRFVHGCIDIFQRPNSRLYAWLGRLLLAREVRGILLWHYVGCDLWRAEANSLRDAFGLPVLLLEPDEWGGASPRIAGRVQAFLESLR